MLISAITLALHNRQCQTVLILPQSSRKVRDALGPNINAHIQTSVFTQALACIETLAFHSLFFFHTLTLTHTCIHRLSGCSYSYGNDWYGREGGGLALLTHRAHFLSPAKCVRIHLCVHVWGKSMLYRRSYREKVPLLHIVTILDMNCIPLVDVRDNYINTTTGD